jgi:hypothetical protein
MLKTPSIHRMFTNVKVLRKLNTSAFRGLLAGEKSTFFRCIQNSAINFHSNAFFLNYRFEILKSFTITLGCYEKV